MHGTYGMLPKLRVISHTVLLAEAFKKQKTNKISLLQGIETKENCLKMIMVHQKEKSTILLQNMQKEIYY